MRHKQCQICVVNAQRSEAKLLKRLQARTQSYTLTASDRHVAVRPAWNAFILNNNKCVRKMCNRQSQHINWWLLNRKSLSMEIFVHQIQMMNVSGSHGRFRFRRFLLSCASSTRGLMYLSNIRFSSVDCAEIQKNSIYDKITWIRFESIQSTSILFKHLLVSKCDSDFSPVKNFNLIFFLHTTIKRHFQRNPETKWQMDHSRLTITIHFPIFFEL